MIRSPRLLAALCLALGAAALPALGQGPSSPVIGYYKFNVPAGRSIWVSGLVTKTDFQGAASSITSTPTTSTINRTQVTWPAFPNHYAEILEGPWTGLVLDITSSTATSITVEGNLGATGFNVPQNVKFAIRAHATLGKLFRGGAGGLRPLEDEIILFDDTGRKWTYYYDDGVQGGRIVGDNFETPSDDVRVYPGQALLLATAGPRTLTFGGGDVSYVKQTPTKIPLYRTGVNLVGLINPIVAASPLTSTAANERASISSATVGLVDSGLNEFEDEILPYGVVGGVFKGLGIYYYRAETDTVGDLDGVPASIDIPFGTGFLIRPAGNERYYTQPGVTVAN